MINKFSKRALGSLGLLLGSISPFTASAKVPSQTQVDEDWVNLSPPVNSLKSQGSDLRNQDEFEGFAVLSSIPADDLKSQGSDLRNQDEFEGFAVLSSIPEDDLKSQESDLSSDLDDWDKPSPLGKAGGAEDLTQSIIDDNKRLFSDSALPAEQMEPVVRMENGKAHISPTLSPKTYAEMERLSYELVKGCVSSSTQLLEKFQGERWEIKGFSGISGKNPQKEGFDGANEDLAGFVAFKEETGEAVVVFHGSQDPYDWQNNLDAQMLFARELNRGTKNPFLFNGRVSKGNAERYLSSVKGLYEILGQFREKKNFHITVTGHSLGGAMGELAVADLATNFAKTVWGKGYDNAKSNRVRAYLMSAALVFDKEASKQVEKLVGRHNVIQDAVESDPVYFLSGNSTVKHLNNSYSYGLTAGAMWLAQKMGFVKTSDLQEVAFLYGKGRHIGFEALQSVSEVQKMAKSFSNKGVKEKIEEEGWFARQKATFTGETVAPIHLGSNQIKQDGSGKLTQGFETKFIDPKTLGERIDKTELAKAQKKAEAALKAEVKKAWYQVWR